MIGFFQGSKWLQTNFYDSCQSFTVHCVSCHHKAKQKGHHKKEGNSKVIDLNAVENTPQGSGT